LETERKVLVSYEGMTEADLLGTLAKECDEVRTEWKHNRRRHEVTCYATVVRGDKRHSIGSEYHETEWRDGGARDWAMRKLLARLLAKVRAEPVAVRP
jgi:hypothetical protein